MACPIKQTHRPAGLWFKFMNVLVQLRAGVVTTSAEGTRALGARLSRVLPVDSTLALHGDLGVGKTTFVQGLAQGFGISSAVTSPTYNILHLYHGRPAGAASGEQLDRPGSGGSVVHDPVGLIPAAPRARPRGPGDGGRTLVHLDAYRLENARQIADLMLDDFLVSPYCLAVEWPDRIADWLPADTLHFTLAIEAPGRHRVALLP